MNLRNSIRTLVEKQYSKPIIATFCGCQLTLFGLAVPVGYYRGFGHGAEKVYGWAGAGMTVLTTIGIETGLLFVEALFMVAVYFVATRYSAYKRGNNEKEQQ